MQTRTESIIETALNIGSGVFVAWLLTIYAMPLFGYDVPNGKALVITCMYTVVSVIRSYAWRRIFNKRQKATAQ